MAAKTHLLMQNCYGEYKIYSLEESNLSMDRALAHRNGDQLDYGDNESPFKFIVFASKVQCEARMETLNESISENTSAATASSSYIETPRKITSPSYSQILSRKRPSSVSQSSPPTKATRINASSSAPEYSEFFQNVNERFHNTDERLGKLEEALSAPRKNRPLKKKLENITVMNGDGEKVLIQSISRPILENLLVARRAFLPPPPQIPGINHTHVVETLNSALLDQLNIRVTGEFSFRLASYFLSEQAFIQSYFPPASGASGKNHSNSEHKRSVKVEIREILQYYALFFGGTLFDHDIGMRDEWMNAIRTGMNSKVDSLRKKIRKGETYHYISYLNHIPLYTEETAFT